MVDLKKLFLTIMCIFIIPVCLGLSACKDPENPEQPVIPKLELMYTDIHMLENSTLDVKIIIEPENYKDKELVVNLPQSSCLESVTIETIDNQKFLRIKSASYLENESEILKGAYVYFKDYDSAETQKSFGVTVHKNALVLETPQNLTYDEYLGTIEWKKVEGARFYEVSINDEILSTSLTSMVLNESYYGKKLDIKIRSVYDLVNKFPAFVDSEFTQTLTFMVLQKPQNLRHENQVIYWDKVVGAKTYSLIISTPSIFGDRQNEKIIEVEASGQDVETYSGYNFASSTTYTIRVKANGNNDLGYTIYGTQDSKSIQVKKLTAPTNLSFTQGVLSWDNIEQNNGYEISVSRYNVLTEKYDTYKTDVVNNANSYRFDTFDGSVLSGQYMLSVKTKGDNKSTLSGEDIESTITTKLPNVNNVRIQDGGIFWDSVEMATSYTIYLNATPITLIKDDADFNSYFLGSSLVAGEYTIEVVACGDGTTFYNSNKSQTLTATKLNPTNLTLYQNELSWKKVSGATNYVLYLNTQEILLGNVDKYTITNELESGEYKAKVMATCQGKISSEYSKVITFNKLQAPKNLRVEEGLVKWDKVEKGTTYNLYFTYTDLPQDVQESTYKKMTMVKNYYDFKGEKAGYYQVYITASGGENTITSSQTEPMIIKKLATPKTPWVEGGNLSYETIDSGTLMVKTKGSSQEVVAENFKPSKDAVELSLCLYAKGNSGENGENLVSSGDSEYLPTKVISSLTTPIIKDGKLVYIFPEGVTGIKVDFYKSGSLNKCYEIINNKETQANDFVGSIDLRCYDNPELGAGFYNLTIIPQFPSATIESVNSGNNAYIYGGKDMKLSFCQLAKPQLIGSYCLNQEGINAINRNVSEEDFDTIVKSFDSNKYAGYLYWSKISGATAYLLKINNNDNTTKVIYPNSLIFTEDNRCLYRLDGDFTTDMNGYNFSVKALGDESSYLSGEYSEHTEVNKIKLNNVGDIKVKDGNLTWNQLDGAFYEVSYNGNIAYTYKNTFNLPLNSASGVYTIKVRALPKSEYYYAGEYSTRENVVKISSPIKFYISGGQVQWSIVNNASRYVIEINGLTKEFNQEDYAFNLKDVVNTEDYFVQKDGNFDIKFTVVGTEDSDRLQSEYLYLSSSPLNISTTIMTAPSSMYVENGVLTWTPVVGAQKYYLEFYNSETSSSLKNAYIDSASEGNRFSLGKDYESGLYYFTVTAIGNGSNYLDSPQSKEYSAHKLSVLDDITIQDGKITFSERAGASSYNAQVNVYEDQNIITENFKGNVFALGSNYSYGRYQIKIQAVGNTTSQDNVNEICYLSSDYSQFVMGYSEITTNTVNYVYKLQPSSNMYVANDAINWEKVNNAVGYNLQVDQTVINLKDTGSIQLKSGNINGKYYEFSSGSFNVNVQTYGGSYFLNSNFRETNMVATKLDQVLGLGVEDGVISWNTVNYIPDNLALYINGEFKTNLRKSFFETYDKNIGGVRGDKTYYVLGQEYGPGDYNIHFINSGGGTTGYLSSDACNAITVSKINSPTNIGIDSNTNSIVWEMPTIENTSIKYTINLYDYQTDKLVQTFDTLDELSLVIKSLDVGKYYVRVGTIIKSSDKLLVNSDISDKLTVTMPAIPINLKIENGVISWTAIEGVSGYNLEISFYEGTSANLSGNESLFRITLNNENQNQIPIKDFTNEESFVSLAGIGKHSEFTTLGKYKVRVNAFVSNSLQSNYSDFAGDKSSNGVNGYYLFQMFSDGKGTKLSPYKITNFEQLKNIAYLPSLYYSQSTHIVTNGMPFTSIGNQNQKFTGEYDGNGYNIDDLVLVCDKPEEQGYSGMFGYIGESGVVKNVNIIKATSTQGYYVGGICGYNEGIIYNSKIQNGKIESKTQTTTTTPKPIYIGGICGYNSLNAIIDKCTYKGYVTTIETLRNYVSYSGGITGYNYGTVCQCVTDKFNTTDKVMGTYAGGIVGYNINTISYVESNTEQPIGSIYKSTNKIDVACYSLKNAISSVSGAAGGIAGMNILKSDDALGKCVNNNYSIAFSNSFATVICDPNETGLVPYAGGIVGYAGNGLYSCYTVGAVYGQINGSTTTDVGSGAPLVNVGRVVGYKGANNYQIDYCFYNELQDTNLNQVGAESRSSRTNGLRVGTNCYAVAEQDFKNATMADVLNAGLVQNNHTGVWKNIVGEYPTFTFVDRVFD